MINMKDYFTPNLNFCKGCGICAKECPRAAITMVAEGEFANEGAKR
jgi:Pyruvate/2-oxoacid:ferredoxin oxidoreductase delta subunit